MRLPGTRRSGMRVHRAIRVVGEISMAVDDTCRGLDFLSKR
jgi:hypothetical protein